MLSAGCYLVSSFASILHIGANPAWQVGLAFLAVLTGLLGVFIYHWLRRRRRHQDFAALLERDRLPTASEIAEVTQQPSQAMLAAQAFSDTSRTATRLAMQSNRWGAWLLFLMVGAFFLIASALLFASAFPPWDFSGLPIATGLWLLAAWMLRHFWRAIVRTQRQPPVPPSSANG